MRDHRFDVVVVGAGVFGAWTARHLTARGKRVVLIDAYGPAHSRASSGGETRIIRMGYGTDELYTRWAQRSLEQWKEFFAAARQSLFLKTGVLWLSGRDNSRLRETAVTLERCGVAFERLDVAELRERYAQVDFADVREGILEPESGVLLARRAVTALVEDLVRRGAEYSNGLVEMPRGSGALKAISTTDGEKFEAEQFVFACGPWLGKLFPEILRACIFPTRQEVFFFGTPAGNSSFEAPALPTWLFQEDEFYGMPDIEGRGLKIAWDGHGEQVDPDTQSRMVSVERTNKAREYVARRFPAMRDAPIVETRVCQYENTSSGDFLVDRHPEMENVWFAGGGSGHGFKHGPALGEYVARQLLDGAPAEGRFLLSSKSTTQRRAIF